jgi:hypothetical protein
VSSGRASEVHRDEETVDSGLASAAAEIGSIVPVEYPIVAVLAGQCLGDGDFPAVTVIAVDLIIVVGDAVHLVGPQVMCIGRSATRGRDPVGNRLAVGPIIMRRGRRGEGEDRAELTLGSNGRVELHEPISASLTNLTVPRRNSLPDIGGRESCVSCANPNVGMR